MIASINRFLGWCVLGLIWCVLAPIGFLAFGPHARTCQCSGCVRKRERAQHLHDQQFPPKPGEVLRTMEEWEAIWEEEEE